MSDWIDYFVTPPTAAGVYEWSVPLAVAPDMTVTVLAHMRKRGAGYSDIVSPAFDYWNGYRVTVPAGRIGAQLRRCQTISRRIGKQSSGWADASSTSARSATKFRALLGCRSQATAFRSALTRMSSTHGGWSAALGQKART